MRLLLVSGAGRPPHGERCCLIAVRTNALLVEVSKDVFVEETAVFVDVSASLMPSRAVCNALRRSIRSFLRRDGESKVYFDSLTDFLIKRRYMHRVHRISRCLPVQFG